MAYVSREIIFLVVGTRFSGHCNSKEVKKHEKGGVPAGLTG